MKIKLLRQYKKAKPSGVGANTVFVYTVSGSKEQIETYKEAQGENFVEDEETKSPLFFTIRFAGKSGNLIISREGKVSPDMSAYDQAASLIEQFPGALGQEMAKIAAANLLGGANSNTVATAPVKEGKLDEG